MIFKETYFCSPSGVMAKVLDYGSEVSEFEIQSHSHVLVPIVII